jgi:hypothetical protein
MFSIGIFQISYSSKKFYLNWYLYFKEEFFKKLVSKIIDLPSTSKTLLRLRGEFLPGGVLFSQRKSILLGVCFVAEGPVRRNTFGRSTQKQSRSYYPGSFGIVTRVETKGGTDLKMKRPIGPR